MNLRISRLGVAMIIGFAALFIRLNMVQVFGVDFALDVEQREVTIRDDLNDDPQNFRTIERVFDEPRGSIASADGAVIARSVPTPDSRFALQREYPQGELFAHVAGYLSLEFGATGVERTYNEQLAGTTVEQQYQQLSDLFVDRDTTANVTLTLRRDVQEAARVALGDRKGSVVALDPRTGSVIAMWSFPSFESNVMADHDLTAVRQNRSALLADPDKPLLPRAFRERFFPGSTFKVVTAAIGVEEQFVSTLEPDYAVSDGYVPPASSRPIRNFGGSLCGGVLVEILTVSCNTAFAEMGAVTIGPDSMIAGAARFGFNDKPPLDLPAVATSTFPTDFGARIAGDGGPGSTYENSAALAQSAIGQNDVAATPLQMALVAGALANDGTVMTPHVMAEVIGNDGQVIERYTPRRWLQATSAASARTIRDAMINVVIDGTGKRMAVDGFTVGGKTGTAEASGPDVTHAWMIGFGGPPNQPATVAVAVIVEADPALGQQTGGTVAAPIAQQVLAAALVPAAPVEGEIVAEEDGGE